jgi:hypothetical protein
MLGMVIVTGALISYSIAVLSQQRQHCLNPRIMTFLTLGICLDIAATTFMILGSRNIPFTVHGFIGYSALLGMLIDTLLTWRHWKSINRYDPVSPGLSLYTRVAYIWWVVAYLAGGAIAAMGVR